MTKTRATPAAVPTEVEMQVSTKDAPDTPSTASVSTANTPMSASSRFSTSSTSSKRKATDEPDDASAETSKDRAKKVKKVPLLEIPFDDPGTVTALAISHWKGEVPCSNVPTAQTQFVLSLYTVKELKGLWQKYTRAHPFKKKQVLIKTLASLIHKHRDSMLSSEPQFNDVAKDR